MSLLLATNEGWIISHLQLINEIYNKVKYEQKLYSLSFNDVLFQINSRYLRYNQMPLTTEGETPIYKRKSQSKKRPIELPSNILEEINFIKNAFTCLMDSAKSQGLFIENVIPDNNKAACMVSEKFYLDTYNNEMKNFHGCNDNDSAIMLILEKKNYIFPKKCHFYCYDIKNISSKLQMQNQFDFILLDPPWWNKSVRRKKSKHAETGYQMMYNEELIEIPIASLLHKRGIIAVWCTNSPSHINSVLNEIFPAWGITYKSKWFWVKVTQMGDTVCEFNFSLKKQPYELLILGTASKGVDIDIPDGKLIISVPSAVHSHKPPLTEIIKEYIPNNPNCLEIFARYLLPGWTSWGLEVLKFQHHSFYTTECETV